MAPMQNLTSSPPRVKNGEFSEKVSPQASYFSPAGSLLSPLEVNLLDLLMVVAAAQSCTSSAGETQ